MNAPMPWHVTHYEGDPDGCSEWCSANNIHPGDEITGVCERCGGSARACAPLPGGCRESGEGQIDDGW